MMPLPYCLSPFPPSNPEYHALAPEVTQALSTRQPYRNRCVYLKSRGGKFNLPTLASTLLRFIPSFGNRDSVVQVLDIATHRFSGI